MGNSTNHSSDRSGLTFTVNRGWILGLAAILAVGWLGLGFSLGLLVHTSASSVTSTAPAPSTATTTSSTTTPTTTAGGSPFTIGAAFPFSSTTVDTLSGQPTTLARGSRATVVLAMASWCLFCAYEDKYVMPVLAKTPGVVIDVVDVSPQGGIGDPGPENPPFTGHDNVGGPITVAGMEQTMQEYVKTFGTLSASNIHVYVAPTATQDAWNITSFPTMAFINAHGQVADAVTVAQTISQGQADLQTALSAAS